MKAFKLILLVFLLGEAQSRSHHEIEGKKSYDTTIQRKYHNFYVLQFS